MNGVPYFHEIDFEIAVNESMAHPDYLRPRDFRMRSAGLVGYHCGSFPYDLNGLEESF